MLRAVADDDLRGLVVQVVVGLELFRDRLTQFGDAARWRVLGEAGFDRSLGRGLDVLRSIKIRFACSEAADVNAFGFHRLGFRVNAQGERWSQNGGSFS